MIDQHMQSEADSSRGWIPEWRPASLVAERWPSGALAAALASAVLVLAVVIQLALVACAFALALGV